MVYLGFVRPFADYQENIIMIVNEIFLLTFYSSFIIFELGLVQISSKNLSNIAIKIVIITMCFNIFVNSIRLLKDIINKIKQRCKMNSSKINPAVFTTSTKKFDEKII